MSLAPLHEFFVDAFESNEALLIFLDRVAPELKPSLPNVSATRDTYAFRATELLRARGYLDGAFFQALLNAFPRRAEDIKRLAAAQLGDAAAKSLRIPPIPPPDPKSATSPAKSDGKLRVLLLAANPLGRPELDLAEEAERIERALTRRDLIDRVRVDIKWAVTPELLVRTLSRYSPAIVHFAGHGNDRGEPQLLGPDDQTKTVLLSSLQRLFRSASSVQCVVLNACYSVRVSQELVDDVPVVIGMRDAVRDGSSLAFAEDFYNAIADGHSLRDAFDLAKAGIATRGLEGAKLLQIDSGPDVEPRRIVPLPRAQGGAAVDLPNPPPPPPTGPSPALVRELVELLLSNFSSDEFLRFLRFHGDTAPLMNDLPGPATPRMTLFTQACDLLVQRNLLDDGFFARWVAERPRRGDEVRGLQAKFRRGAT